jgi:hypothetical protein
MQVRPGSCISDLLRVIVCTVAVLFYDVHGLCQLAVYLAIAIVVQTCAGFSINVDLDELTRSAGSHANIR